MANLEHFRRVVYRHDWNDTGEWVSAIEALADLTDAELTAIPTAGERIKPKTQ